MLQYRELARQNKHAAPHTGHNVLKQGAEEQGLIFTTCQILNLQI